jgi:hypothetical protein
VQPSMILIVPSLATSSLLKGTATMQFHSDLQGCKPRPGVAYHDTYLGFAGLASQTLAGVDQQSQSRQKLQNVPGVPCMGQQGGSQSLCR